MRELLIGITAVVVFLIGCNQSMVSPTQQGSKHWVAFYSTISNPHYEYYVLTDEKVSRIGRALFDFRGSDTVSQGPAHWETNDVDAIQVYAIVGVDTKEAVAVKMKDGSYVKANAVGNKQP